MNSGDHEQQAVGELAQFYFRRTRNARPIRNNRGSKDPAQISERTGHWSQKQNAKYYAFLQKFKQKFNQKESRRQWKVFKALAQFIKTRNANQCRSHHHKMQKNYKTIEETLHFLAKKRPILESKSQKYIEQLNSLEMEIFDERNDKFNQDYQNQKERQEERQQMIKPRQAQWSEEEELAKKNTNANMKTGTGYDDSGVQPHYPNTEMQYPIGQLTQSMFPQMGLQNSPYQNINIPQLYPDPHPYPPNPELYSPQPYPSLHILKQQKLLEAHECFLKWITKLRSLIYREQSEMYSYSTLPENNMIYSSYL